MKTPSLPIAPALPAAVDNSLSFQGLNQLSAAAKANPRNPAAIKAVAQQFEALLVQQMLAAMSATSLGPDMLGGTAGPMFKSLFNQQIATTISQGQGIGLASFIAKELATRYGGKPHDPSAAATVSPKGSAVPKSLGSQTTPAASGIAGYLAHRGVTPAPATPSHATEGGERSALHNKAQAFIRSILPSVQQAATALQVSPVAIPAPATPSQATEGGEPSALANKAQAFIRSILPSVQQAATALQVSPVAILAQAALETGWGSHAPGHNLFGMKASADWSGASLSRLTSEVAHGVTHLGSAAFRAYQSAADSVQSYTQMLLGSPRYQSVLGHGSDIAGFAAALQHAGYATDPRYASKLVAMARSPLMRDALSALGLQAN
ncbi:glucosaminidase domain-containing protein [Thiomonas sp. FB-Cd]|uniref:glucosaminidase domain-containing protein n=1 Tax=Thiomonas sp. FB-Cd TaxID=1158292 RepID=UPI0004DF6251|nr:glucosaminidase domain-containing protein [Thiomonas sp. FB-Cd]